MGDGGIDKVVHLEGKMEIWKKTQRWRDSQNGRWEVRNGEIEKLGTKR